MILPTLLAQVRRRMQTRYSTFLSPVAIENEDDKEKDRILSYNKRTNLMTKLCDLIEQCDFPFVINLVQSYIYYIGFLITTQYT